MSSTDVIHCPSCGENIPMDYITCPYDGYSLIKQLREKTRVKIKLREGISRFIRLTRDPRKNTNIVIDEIITNFDRKGPIFILFLLAWVFGFQIAPYYNAMNSSGGSAPDIGFIFFLGFFGGLFIAIATILFYIIFWYLISMIIHFSSKLLTSSVAGSASLKETQSVVGYSLTPYVIGLFILNTLLFILLPTNLGGSFIKTTNTTLFGNVADGFNPAVNSAVGLFYTIFYFGFSAWSVYICGNGLEKLHRLPKNQAFIIPSVIVILIYILPSI